MAIWYRAWAISLLGLSLSQSTEWSNDVPSFLHSQRRRRSRGAPPAGLQRRAQSQNALQHCDEVTKDSLDIKVVMSDVVQENVCETVGVDFDSMMEHCSAFCGEHAVPIVVGTDSVGFPLDDIDGVCLGNHPSTGPGGSDADVILQYNPDKMRECADWSVALTEINLKAADFIASVRNMTFEQLVFRSSMQEKVDLVQVAMQSEETAAAVNLARVDRKLDVLTRILHENLADFMGDGMLKRRLRDKLDALRVKSELLQTTIDRNLPLLQRFVDECNDLLLATGPANEYLLDICSVTSNECIEAEDEGVAWGRHAGCCCGVVPAVGHFTIPATKLGSRRLEANQPVEQNVDVCGQAYEVGAAGLQEAREQLCQSEYGPELIEEHAQMQHEAYPEYFDCSRNLLEEEHSKTPVKMEDLPSDLPSVDERRLQETPVDFTDSSEIDYLTCSPPSSPSDDRITDPLKVAFWDHTESALCKDIVEEDGAAMNTERLAEICADFCTPTAVPFLLGTTSFGFSQEQLDSVCLAPEDLGTLYSAETVASCHAKASAFETLQSKTAAFAAALQVLDASKIRFEAGTRAATDNFRQIIQEQGQQTLDDATQSQKIVALKRLFHTALDDILNVNSNLKGELHRDADAVKQRTIELNAALDEVIPQMEDFMSSCNMMTTGVGPSGEYLLDMCSQTSQECVESVEASHVGCCCGYNPVVTLGTSAVSRHQTISGLSAETFANAGDSTRVGIGRRLQADTAIDICAQASATSAERIEEHQQVVRDLGAGDLIANQADQHRANYPAYYSRCSEWTCERPEGGAVSSAAVPQGRSMVVLLALIALCFRNSSF